MQTPPQATTATNVTVTKPRLASLLTILEEVPDPRVTAPVDHALADILTIALCTILCGGQSFYDREEFGRVRLDWLKTFLCLRHGAPTHDTYNRLFQALDPEQFGDCLARWTQSVRRVLGGEVVALDGKTLRRALNKGEDTRVLVHAWATQSGLLLGQRKVRDKSNEITAVPELLRVLELAGCIVTVDAMGCQKKIAKEIHEADADYVLALKGNQETVHDEVKTYLDAALLERTTPRPAGAKLSTGEATLAEWETVEKDHGRIETRRYYQSAELAWFADRVKWEGLRSVGMVEAIREVDGKTTVERRHYLTSLPLDVKTFARAVRGHWGVENKLHWVLDVWFREDQSRARAGHAAENLATLRRLALNLLKREKTKKRGIKGKQLNAGWDHAYLLRLLGAEI